MGKTRTIRSLSGVAVLLAALGAASAARAQDVPMTLRQRALQHLVMPLSSVVLPDSGSQYLTFDRQAARILGKALFWDAQVGSDGQACASCHFHAGADSRSKNQINPGFRNENFAGGDSTFGNSNPLVSPASTPAFGPNYQLTLADFPLHKLSNEADPASLVVSDTNDVISSQGSFAAMFTGVGFPADQTSGLNGDLAKLFDVGGGAIVRSVAPRNTPPSVNAVFNRRNFWDSRARDTFNGVDPIGDLDRGAQVVQVALDASGNPLSVGFTSVAIPGASAASQAVGPPTSDVEMSYHGRQNADIGRKLFSPELTALSKQLVATDDSVLGPYSAQLAAGPGVTGITLRYAELVKQAFLPQWWNAPGYKVDVSTNPPTLRKTSAVGPNLYTVMEYNFAFFFGLAVQEYEKMLRADDTPLDRFLQGDDNALDFEQKIGLDVFMGRGRCKECHTGPLLSNASIVAQDTTPVNTDQLLPPHNIERMIIGSPCSPEEQLTLTCPVGTPDPVVRVYDAGFYNIGVRPTKEDLGIGARIGPENLPLSHSQKLLECLRKEVLTSSVAQANLTCQVPHIAARPIEAALVLARAWKLASLDGLKEDVTGVDASGKTVVLTPGSSTITNDIAVAQALLTGQPLSGAGVAEACAHLVEARDLLAAAAPTLLDPDIATRVANLMPVATSLLPDPVNPGPNALEPFGPPLQPGEVANVLGSFKTPGLRNVELTGPYFHNGGQATLAQVVAFYDRGGDFGAQNLADLDPNIAKIGLLAYEEQGLLSFLKGLTDERVKYERAPFDHPSLSLPNGGTPGGRSGLLAGVNLLDDRIELPAVGAAGHPIPLGSVGTPLANFPDPMWSQLTVVSGGGQSVAPGAALPGNLVVQVLDASGKPVPGVPVSFSAPPGGSVSAAQVMTGLDGKAEVSATLGPTAGAQSFKAEAYAVVGSPLTIAASAAGATTTPPAPSPAKAGGGCSTGAGASESLLFLVGAALLVRRRRLATSFRRLLSGAGVVSVAALIGCGGGSAGTPAVDPMHSVLSAAPASVLADGVATASLSVVARDAAGTALAGRAVVFTVSGSGNALSAAGATTGADGSAAVTLTSTKAEPKSVSATVSGVALAPATVAFVPYAGCTFCGGTCQFLQTDAANCGACGHACGAAEVCSAGACAVAACTTLRLPPAAPAALVGLHPAAVVSANLHGVADGIADLAIADAGSGDVSILFGAGDGTFSTPLTVKVGGAGTRPASLAAADLNADGTMDLVVANQGDNTVVVLRGIGGTFQAQPPISVGVGPGPAFVAVANLNQDNFPDLVVANRGDGTVSVILSDGAGGFAPPVKYTLPLAPDPVTGVPTTPAVPVSIAIADLDGDGALDLAVADNLDAVSLLKNDGAGVMTVLPSIAVGAGPSSIVAADLDGDGKTDLVVANDLDGTLTVLANTGGFTFAVQPALSVGTDPVFVAAADLDADGRPELVVANGSNDTVGILANLSTTGAIAFAPQQTYSAGFVPSSIAVADLDGNLKPDLAVANLGANALTVLTNLGAGVFAPPATFAARPIYTAGAAPDAVATADLDGDGKADVVVANGGDDTVTVLRNRGDGVLVSPATTFAAGHGPAALATADLNGDGARDLAVADAAGDAVSVLLNVGGGAFAAPASYPTGVTGAKPVSVVAADLNGDGKPDLVVANQGADDVAVLMNNGAGTFLAAVPYPTGRSPSSVVAADFDHDGRIDLAVADLVDGTVSVLINDPAQPGTFKPRVRYTVGNFAAPTPVALVAVDLDGDGLPDLAVANNAENSVSVLLNDPQSPGTFNTVARRMVTYNVAVSPLFLAAADLDKDGFIDLAVASGPLASPTPADGYRAVTVLRNDPALPGSLFQRAYDQLLVTPLALAAADLDGNGRADVVLLGAEGLVPLLSACSP